MAAVLPVVATQSSAGAAPVDLAVLPLPSSVWSPPAQLDTSPVGGKPPSVAWEAMNTATTAQASSGTSDCGPERVGILPQYPMERFPITDRTELQINTQNGNVVVKSRELTIKGTGQNLSIDRIYNSRRPSSGMFGYGWTMAEGQDIGLTFDEDNKVVLHGESGYCAPFTKQADGTFKNPPGLHATLTKDTSGKFILTFDADESTWTFTPQGWLTSQADRNGNANDYRYNTDGTAASVTDSQGRVTTFGYDSDHKVTSITDPTGSNSGTYTYNTAGQLTKVTDRAGKDTTFAYGSNGKLTQLTDPRGLAYSLTYDSTGRISSLTQPWADSSGRVTGFSYGADNTTTETTAAGHTITYTYDEQGRQTKAKDPLGHERKQTWTANSDIQTTTDGLNNSTTNSYDSVNNLTGTKLPTGAKNAVGYTDASHPHQPTSFTDSQGNKIDQDHDRAGNVTNIHSDGLDKDLHQLTYNTPHGTLASDTDGKGAKTTLDYDPAGNLTAVHPPAPLGATLFGYDSLSRTTSKTDGNGVRIDYAYDALDRVVAISVHNGRVLETFEYDENGNLVKDATPNATRYFIYGANNRLVEANRATLTEQEKVDYTYDKDGNVTSLTDPAGATQYRYDAAYRLTSLADAFGQTTTFDYDNADRRTKTNFPGAGTQTNSWDKSGRQTALTVTNTSGTQLLKTEYSYTRGDGTDSDQIQKTTYDDTPYNFTYDSLKRSTVEPRPNSGGNGYTYDAKGNLLNLGITTYTNNAADQLTRTNLSGQRTDLGYDGAGNLTSNSKASGNFTYSPTNQLLTGATPSGQITDSVFDTTDQTQPRSITERLNGVDITHVFTQTSFGVTQVKDNGNALNVSRDPDGKLITERSRDGYRYNMITDYQGSVVAMLNPTGDLTARYRYGTYGQKAAGTTGNTADINPFRYLGAYQFNNGWYQFGYRYYEPNWQRFTAPDPTGQEDNTYAYAKGDPVNKTDRNGSSPACVLAAGGAIGSTLGFVGGVLTAPATLGGGLIVAGAGISSLTADLATLYYCF